MSGSRSDRKQKSLAVWRKHDVSRPMVNPRYPLDDSFGLPGRRNEVVTLVAKTYHPVAN